MCNIKINIKYFNLNVKNKLNFNFIKNIIKKVKIFHNMNISIIFIDKIYSKYLNKLYKKKNYPTNILTFFKKKVKKIFFINIILCINILKKEVFIKKKKFIEYIIYLIIHGLLHILGYSHNNINNFNIMKKLEINIMNLLNFNNPYKD